MTTPTFVPFKDLDRKHVNRDFQVHTALTDGEGTVEAIIARAETLGLEEIAFTEHVRRQSTYFPSFAASVQAARAATAVTVYTGIEAKAEDEKGTLDAPDDALATAELVLGSVHRFPLGDGRFIHAREFDYAEAARRERALALGLVRSAPIHVLSHPGGMCLSAFGTFPAEYFEELMRAALERGIAIEINTSYTKDLDAFLALCRRVNPLVSVGSDVHRLDDLGTCRAALWSRGIGCR